MAILAAFAVVILFLKNTVEDPYSLDTNPEPAA
jgi:hypothetical protein